MQESNTSPLSESQFTTYTKSKFTIPVLPALDACLAKAIEAKNNNKIIDWSKVVIIGQQHFLETTATLFQKIIELGVKPENIHLSDKVYSSNRKVRKAIKMMKINVYEMENYTDVGAYERKCSSHIEKMFEACAEKYKNNPPLGYLLADDGGFTFRMIPPNFIKEDTPIAGFEQTSGGLNNKTASSHSINVVNVAKSSLKKDVEPHHIVTAICNQLDKFLPKNKAETTFGVIGYGVIGKALAEKLLKDGYKVKVFDSQADAMKAAKAKAAEETRFKCMTDLATLINESTHIIGCTGTDVTADPAISNFIENVNHDKHFFNIGSGDVEYASYIKTSQKESKIGPGCLQNFSITNRVGKKMYFYYGGFPINFSNSGKQPWNVPAYGIEATQCALFGALLQAGEDLKKQIERNSNSNHDTNEQRSHMLNPHYQLFVANKWFEAHPEFEAHYPKELLEKYKNNDLKYIISNSSGTLIESDFFRETYGDAAAVSPSNKK